MVLSTIRANRVAQGDPNLPPAKWTLMAMQQRVGLMQICISGRSCRGYGEFVAL